jgi:hypothetical protein
VRLIVASAVICFSPIANSNTIFSTFGPGETFDTSNSWGIGGPPGFIGQTQLAAPFTSSGSYSLDEVDVPIYFGNASLGPNTSTVYITTSPGSGPLESFTFNNLSLPPGDVRSGISLIHPTLHARSTYWIVMTTQLNPINYTFIGWPLNNQGDSGTLYWSNDLGPWVPYPFQTPATLPAFAVLGTPAIVVGTPEPGMLLPVGLSLAVVFLRVIARRQGET